MEVYDDNQPAQPVQKGQMSVGSWFVTILILAIPLLNIIMLFVWAFGGNKDERTNFAKASLIWMLIGVVVSICFVGCVGCAAIAGLMGGASYI